MTGWLPRSEAIRLLAESTAYVHTARWDGAPMTMIEAHALGLPQVAISTPAVADGPALVAAVAALTVRVPVVALVVGRADVADFARSHTGALATSWRTTRAALRAAGAVLVDDER